MSKQTVYDEAEVISCLEIALSVINEAAAKNAKMQAHVNAGVVTPIMLAKLAEVPGPMIYTYCNKGFIVAKKDGMTQRVLIDVNEAAKFLAKRYIKAGQKNDEVRVELANA